MSCPRPPSARLAVAITLALCAAVAPRPAEADVCDEGSLLRGRRAVVAGQAQGDLGAATDGWFVPDGRPPTRSDSVVVTDGTRLRYDLGGPRDAVGIYVQGDASARFEVELLDEAGRAVRAIEAGPVEGRGQRGRGQMLERTRVTAIRVVVRGAPHVALSEVAVFPCAEAMTDAARWTRVRPDPELRGRYDERATAKKLAFGVLSLVLLVSVERWRSRRAARWVRIAVCVGALLAWLDFGAVASYPRGLLHTWDSVHYFLGSKYAPETGYAHLYDCIAESAHRRGLGAWFDRGVMRRFEDNARVPGSYSRRAEARCPSMSDARRAELDRDLVRLESVGMPYGMRPESIVADRGYMATPFGTAWLRLATAHAPASRAFFTAGAIVDALCLIGVVVVLAFGFGLRRAAFVAVAIGVGAPWDYSWLGGALDRHTWLLALAIAMVGLHRRLPILAGTALAFVVLHRIFPLGFALGAIASCLVLAYDRRSLVREDVALVGAFVVCLVAGGLLGAWATSFDAWPELFARLGRHRTMLVANELGVPAALRLFAGDVDAAIDPAQLDAIVPWELRVRAIDAARLPLRLLVLLGCGVLVVRSWRKKRPPLEGAFLGALATLSVTNIASYYGIFLVLAAAIPGIGLRGRAAVLGAAVASQILALSPALPSLDEFGWTSVALLGATAWAVARTGEFQREFGRKVD